jgi:hypothetical protein
VLNKRTTGRGGQSFKKEGRAKACLDTANNIFNPETSREGFPPLEKSPSDFKVIFIGTYRSKCIH